MKEIFECLCKSGSSKKLRIFLDKVMNARMKANQDALSKLDIASRQIMDIQELTPQDEELLMIHTILLENPLKPTAPFQKLLLHFPDCVTHLFDEHVLFINEAINRKDRIYLDLTLFNAEKHQHESELSLISLLFSKRSFKVLEHPLFDLMAQLKWTKVWWLFHIGLIYQMFFMTLTLAFTLVNFSPKYQDDSHKTAINTILMVASILSLLNAGLKIHGFILKLLRRRKRCNKTYIMENNSDLFELFFIINQAVLPIVALFALGTCAFFIYLFLEFNRSGYDSKEIAVLLCLQKSYLLILNIQMIPKLGDYAFIAAQILKTVLVFAISYSPQLVSFAVAFHVLLPENASFGSLDDSLLKVVAMITGELEVSDAVISSNNTLFNKLVFVSFIIILTIVVMNMVLGLAIQDIGELR